MHATRTQATRPQAARTLTLATLIRAFGLAALLPAAPLALADEAAVREHHQHPAVLLQADVSALRAAQRIDTNHFVVAHPARLAFGAPPRANFAHPLFAMRRAADEAAADPTALALQQPATAPWLARAGEQRDTVRLALVAQPTP